MTDWAPAPGPGDAEGLYSVLEVSPHASTAEVRQAHRRQVALWHPDRCTDPTAEARIRWINRARDVLLDDDQRRTYDLAGAHWFEVTLETTAVDTGVMPQGTTSRARCRVRVRGTHPRLHQIDVPRVGDAWWCVDVVAVSDPTDPDALFDLEFTLNAHTPGTHTDRVEFSVADRWFGVDVTSSVKRPGLLRRAASRWSATPQRTWGTSFRHWCILGFLGLIPAGLYVSHQARRLAVEGVITWQLFEAVQMAMLSLGVAAVALTALTKGFRQGTWRTRLVVGAFTIPGVTAALMLIALVAVLLAAVALVVMILIGALSGGD